MGELSDTADRLVWAAEELLISGGEEATSLRAVARTARANAAAVHYHFGGRERLLCAVLERHLAPLAARRLTLLDRVRAQHPDPVAVPATLTALLRADVESLAKLRRHRVELARLIGRAYAAPTPPVAELLSRQEEQLMARLLPLLRPALPELGEAELRIRLRLVRVIVAALFATAPDAAGPAPLGTDDSGEQVRRLVAFCAPGLSGPPVPLGVPAAGKVGKAQRKSRKRPSLGSPA
jgi:AcrR family transcriptional regulator